MRPIALLLLSAALLMAAPSGAQPLIGSPPPDALGRDREGRPVRLADFDGRVVVVSFWASWCAPCLDEMAALEDLQRRIGRERLAVVGVNWREDLFPYRAALRKLDRVQITLTRDAAQQVGEAYGVNEIPALFVVGRDGRLAYRHRGFAPGQSAATLRAEIDALLAAP